MAGETETAIEQFAVLVDQHNRGSHPPLLYQIDLALTALEQYAAKHGRAGHITHEQMLYVREAGDVRMREQRVMLEQHADGRLIGTRPSAP